MSFLGRFPVFRTAWIRRFRTLRGFDRARAVEELSPRRWQEFLADVASNDEDGLVRVTALTRLDPKQWQELLAKSAKLPDGTVRSCGEFLREAAVARLAPERWQVLLADIAETDSSETVRSLAARMLRPAEWEDVLRRRAERNGATIARDLSVLEGRCGADETWSALRSLAETRDPSLVPVFARYLHDQREPKGTNERYRVCVAAMEGLGLIGNDAAVDLLIRTLEDEGTNPHDVQICADALSKTRSPRAISAMKRTMRRVPSIALKWQGGAWRYYASEQGLFRSLTNALNQIDFD
jgi:hypothetical protein